jgi:hypothetical protein
VGLDANNPNFNELNGLKTIMEQCNMVDPFLEITNDTSDFPTQQRGSKRIDYMLCSPNFLQFIDRIGYVHFNEGIDSDHRAIFMDVSETILENDCTIKPKKNRMVGTYSTNEGERYIRHLHNALKSHNVFNRLEDILKLDLKQLSENEKNSVMEKINNIDKTVTEQMLCSEKKTCSLKDGAGRNGLLSCIRLI